jgi:ABC-type glycerol-3-phosphate transport system substrate-binding protein
MISEQALNSRRQFLATATLSGMAILGCNRESNEPEAPAAAAPRRDIPLRVLLCGTEAWADALKTAWSGIAEQPLQVTVLDAGKIDPGAWQAAVVKALPQSDVTIVPMGLVPAIEAASGLTPLGDDLVGPDGIDASSFFAMLREGSMKFGGRAVSIPLGAVQPALALNLSAFDGKSISPPDNWASFIDLAKKLNEAEGDKSTDAIVAEPLADGAAAKMFLWRASAAEPEIWLFDRESFKPVIDSPTYVEVLETMKQCAAQYRGARLTPGEVWSRIASGKLKMAIGWPAVSANAERIEEVTEYEFAPLPSLATNSDEGLQANAPKSTLVDCDSPVAILSSHCRQSDAAKRFLKWIVDGEGTGMIKNAVTGLTDVRALRSVGSADSSARNPEAAANVENKGGDYATLLTSALSSLRIRTPFQLLEYRRYMQVLDEAVLACLDDKQTASEALSAAATKWQLLTTEIGIKPQTQAWRKAQGLQN